MKASEFAAFFEFSIDYVENMEVPASEMDGYWDSPEDSPFTGYLVTDDQGVLHTRYIKRIGELTECFDSLLDDYIFDDYEERAGKPFKDMEDIQKWLLERGEINPVIEAFVNGRIEDDIKLREVAA